MNDILKTIESIDTKEISKGFSNLSTFEKIVWLVSAFDFEVNLGGVEGYLSNSAGDGLPLLAEAFDTIGCHSLAACSRNLTYALSKHCNPVDRQSRASVVDRMDPCIAAAMSDFESGIQSCLDDYGDQLVRFIESGRESNQIRPPRSS